jgi:hypothetical protein
MADLDIDSLASQMAAAAAGVLKQKWPDAAAFAKTEFQKIAYTIANIGEMVADKQINSDQAELLLDMQKNASRAVLLTIEGLGLLAVEEAINAALDVVKTVVNKAVGFGLI